MLTTEFLPAFAVAALLVILIPGPTVLLVTGYALSRGLGMALLCMVGVILGDAIAMLLTFVGLGALLAASAEGFLILKWLGAAYLIYLGVELWRAPWANDGTGGQKEGSPLGIMIRGFTANVLHPKGLAFYSAFLPQFISPASPALPQMFVLGLTFMAIAFSVLLGYAFAAARFSAFLTQPRIRRLSHRTGAACLVGAGIYTLSLNRG
jgi:homoserine/homoserine lactone efflux protein